ncbi:MAG: hypothetical protein M0R66_01235 [Candidatus Omnitrophica bacterium]|nr:hypothetical protein [Candidatus Omnitrophota bacterium]
MARETIGFQEHARVTGILEAFERRVGETAWKPVLRQHNLITNAGWASLAQALTGLGATSYQYFAWGDGTTAPSLTRTAADFYSDCANYDTKAVSSGGSIDAFNTTTLTQKWNVYLTATDNAVANIKKIAFMNDDPGTIMWNEIKLTSTLPKDETIERYFRYTLTFQQA